MNPSMVLIAHRKSGNNSAEVGMYPEECSSTENTAAQVTHSVLYMLTCLNEDNVDVTRVAQPFGDDTASGCSHHSRVLFG